MGPENFAEGIDGASVRRLAWNQENMCKQAVCILLMKSFENFVPIIHRSAFQCCTGRKVNERVVYAFNNPVCRDRIRSSSNAVVLDLWATTHYWGMIGVAGE